MDQKAVTEVKANGQTIKTTIAQTLDYTWAVQSVDAGGSADMVQTFDRVRTKFETPFGLVEYDSKAEKEPGGVIAAGLIPVLKALVGAKFKYKISPQGELSDIQVPESLMKTLKEAGPAAAGNAGMFSEEGLKNVIRDCSLILPAESLDKPWTRQKKIASPPLGTQVFDMTYKYEGVENNEDKIGMELKVRFEPDPTSNVKAKLASQEGKGSFYFDSKVGRVVRSSMSQKVEMVIEVMANQVNQNSDSTTDIKLVKAEGGSAK
jgi:hypothetical protein